jgi:Ca2+-binding RTX toxin-like protein
MHAESFQHGIVTTYNADTDNLKILNNVIENWNEGAYLNPGVHDSTFSGNAFSDNGNHIVSDGVDDFTIANNNFGASDGSKIFVNVYANPTDLEVELGLSGNTFAPDHARLSVAPYGANGQVVLGTSGNDNLRGDFGTALDVTLDGRGGNDLLVGTSGNDTLIGGADSDTVNGGAGNDRIIGTLDGVADTYNGDANDAVNAVAGTGGDTIDYAATTNGISVTLSGGAATVIDDEAGTDTLSGIENVTGGSGGDIITGDNNANILIGGGGVDSLTGSNGADRLVGGAGADNLSGGIGADIFVYEQRADGGNAVSGQDLISGFSVGEADKFAFDDGFFAGLPPLPGDFNDSGHVNASYFLVTNVSGTSYAGGANQPIFVLDDVSPGFAGTLWFDAEGDGALNGANDVKIADMSNASVLTGFNQDHLLLI